MLLFDPELDATDSVDIDGEMDPICESFDSGDDVLLSLSRLRFLLSRLAVRGGVILFVTGFPSFGVAFASFLSNLGKLDGRGMLPFVSIGARFDGMLSGRASVTDGGRNFDRNCVVDDTVGDDSFFSGFSPSAPASSAAAKRHLVGTGYFSMAACETENKSSQFTNETEARKRNHWGAKPLNEATEGIG